jgi:hypothetical protein
MSQSVTMLNEYCQKNGLPTPVYKIISKEGPSHAPTLTVILIIKDKNQQEQSFKASALNKKKAQRECADMAVQKLNINQFFEENEKTYRYKICEIEPVLEDLWKQESNEIVLTIKRSNNQDEFEIKCIKLKIIT